MQHDCRIMFEGEMASNGIETKDPRYLPAYSTAEAARYLHMPEETLRSWIIGRWYPAAGQSKRSKALIRPDDPRRKYLSFINLVEAHILAAIRRRHGVSLAKIRPALDYARHEFTTERPLIDHRFQTDGLDLFVERYGDLINASRQGQKAMKEIIGVYLKRIERDADGLPIKLYPFTRDTESDTVPKSDPRVIVMNPAVSFGRPVIAGTGIPAQSVYERYKAGDSVGDLARDFRLDAGTIEEAIRCEAA
jgi:uncharacterized protein (DUF433 family)